MSKPFKVDNLKQSDTILLCQPGCIGLTYIISEMVLKTGRHRQYNYSKQTFATIDGLMYLPVCDCLVAVLFIIIYKYYLIMILFVIHKWIGQRANDESSYFWLKRSAQRSSPGSSCWLEQGLHDDLHNCDTKYTQLVVV